MKITEKAGKAQKFNNIKEVDAECKKLRIEHEEEYFRSCVVNDGEYFIIAVFAIDDGIVCEHLGFLEQEDIQP